MRIPTAELEVGSVITLLYGCIDKMDTSEDTRKELNSVLSTHQFLRQTYQMFYYPMEHSLPEEQYEWAKGFFKSNASCLNGGIPSFVITSSPLIFETFLTYMEKLGYMEKSKIYLIDCPMTIFSSYVTELSSKELIVDKVYKPMAKIMQELENEIWRQD